MQFHDGTLEEDWRSYVLIVPVVSVGNVGQLAADLLISSLALHRKGALHHDALLPCLGNAAFSHALGPTFGLEVFCDPARKLACLQQRSPAAPGLQVELAQAMAAWIAQTGFKQVWVLGSLDATFRTDSQLAGPQLRFWSRDAPLLDASTTTTGQGGFGLQPLEEGWFRDKPLESRLLPPWPLLLALREQGVPCAALLTFSLDGDNRPDAYLLAGAAARLLGLAGGSGGGAAAAGAGDGLAWRPPSSWQFAFGRGEPSAVY